MKKEHSSNDYRRLEELYEVEDKGKEEKIRLALVYPKEGKNVHRSGLVGLSQPTLENLFLIVIEALSVSVEIKEDFD